MRRFFSIRIFVSFVSVIVLSQPAQSEQLQIAWTFPGPSNSPYSIITYSTTGQGMVYTVIHGNKSNSWTESDRVTKPFVVALDLKTGKKHWIYELESKVLSPLLYLNGSVIVYDIKGNLICLEASTGRSIWKVETVPQHGKQEEELSVPSGKGDRFFLREGSNLVSRDIKDGRLLWKNAISAPSNEIVCPSLVDEKIILSTSLDDVIAFSQDDGEQLWKISPEWLDSLMVVSEKYSWYTVFQGKTRTLSNSDGSQIWAYPDPIPSSPEPTPGVSSAWPLSVLGEKLFLHQESAIFKRDKGGTPYFVSRGFEICCLDHTKERVKWKFPLAEELAGFSLAGGRGIVVQKSSITLLDLNTGQPVWEFKRSEIKGLQGEALVTQGKIMVIGSNGLYCLETGDPTLTGWPQARGTFLRTGRGKL